MDMLRSEIAAVAARMVVEDGLEFGPAKQRAVRQLGLPARTALPGNDELEDAVRDYLQLFRADTQPAELAALRALALAWMERMASFRPYLAGAVWRGTATRQSDIHIHLYCDDPKSAEFALLDHGVAYETGVVPGPHGADIPALTMGVRSRELGLTVGIHFLVHDHDDLRGALKADPRGRLPRGGLEALRRLVQGAAA